MLQFLKGLTIGSSQLTFRPFRTSAIAMAAFLFGALWLVLGHDLKLSMLGDEANGVVNLVFDTAAFILAIGYYGQSLLRLSDDGGESDAVKLSRDHIEYMRARDKQFYPLLEKVVESMGEHRPRDDA